MSNLSENIYHPDILARIYRVLFLDAESEQGWSNLVAARNEDYARYLTPPQTAAGTISWVRSIENGQMADTLTRLNEKWGQVIEVYVSTAVAAGSAKRIVQLSDISNKGEN